MITAQAHLKNSLRFPFANKSLRSLREKAGLMFSRKEKKKRKVVRKANFKPKKQPFIQ